MRGGGTRIREPNGRGGRVGNRSDNPNRSVTFRLLRGAPIPNELTEFVPMSVLEQFKGECMDAAHTEDFQQVVTNYNSRYNWPDHGVWGTEMPHRETCIEVIYGSLEYCGIRTGYVAKNNRYLHMNLGKFRAAATAANQAPQVAVAVAVKNPVLAAAEVQLMDKEPKIVASAPMTSDPQPTAPTGAVAPAADQKVSAAIENVDKKMQAINTILDCFANNIDNDEAREAHLTPMFAANPNIKAFYRLSEDQLRTQLGKLQDARMALVKKSGNT